ncbi:IS30 family transposase [Listeria booriae]|nr:IS30 family transposase [Listeria booriae]MBC1232158.1 IS30 family transposase [Listeria booriae]
MSLYQHLTISEREKILVGLTQEKSIREIARDIGRAPSTVSREIKRNTLATNYSANQAQQNYVCKREACRRKKLLSYPSIKQKVRHLLLHHQWSPEQISKRLKQEDSPIQISYITIYRGIYTEQLEGKKLSKGERGIARKLRHRGKTRHTKGHNETRGKIKISNSIHVRPKEANERSCIGHWEADTVLGKTGLPCLITLTDRCSRYLLAEKIPCKKARFVTPKLIEMFQQLPKYKVKTVTPDRGKEFAKHAEVSMELDELPFYFADPHAPWQRGTNENTNGLLREYFPKNEDMTKYDPQEIRQFIYKLNTRPRKCLGWKTPYEVFFDEVLHLT